MPLFLVILILGQMFSTRALAVDSWPIPIFQCIAKMKPILNHVGRSMEDRLNSSSDETASVGETYVLLPPDRKSAHSWLINPNGGAQLVLPQSEVFSYYIEIPKFADGLDHDTGILPGKVLLHRQKAGQPIGMLTAEKRTFFERYPFLELPPFPNWYDNLDPSEDDEQKREAEQKRLGEFLVSIRKEVKRTVEAPGSRKTLKPILDEAQANQVLSKFLISRVPTLFEELELLQKKNPKPYEKADQALQKVREAKRRLSSALSALMEIEPKMQVLRTGYILNPLSYEARLSDSTVDALKIRVAKSGDEKQLERLIQLLVGFEIRNSEFEIAYRHWKEAAVSQTFIQGYPHPILALLAATVCAGVLDNGEATDRPLLNVFIDLRQKLRAKINRYYYFGPVLAGEPEEEIVDSSQDLTDY